MRFNREKFIDETSGDIGAALDIMDELVQMINSYCEDDEHATGYGDGVYGTTNRAEEYLISTIKDKLSGEFIESTF